MLNSEPRFLFALPTDFVHSAAASSPYERKSGKVADFMHGATSGSPCETKSERLVYKDCATQGEETAGSSTVDWRMTYTSADTHVNAVRTRKASCSY